MDLYGRSHRIVNILYCIQKYNVTGVRVGLLIINETAELLTTCSNSNTVIYSISYLSTCDHFSWYGCMSV